MWASSKSPAWELSHRPALTAGGLLHTRGLIRRKPHGHCATRARTCPRQRVLRGNPWNLAAPPGVQRRNPGRRMLSVLLSLLMPGTLMPTESSSDLIQGTSPVTSVTLATPARNFTEPFIAVIHLRLTSDWYLYWTNPGDAGLPLAVRWKLPEGFRAGELKLRLPKRLCTTISSRTDTTTSSSFSAH